MQTKRRRKRKANGAYLIVAEALRRRIHVQGPRMEFPRFTEIQAEFEVSRGVVVRAAKILRDQGLVLFVPGQGYRVLFGGPRPDPRTLDEKIAAVIEERGLLVGDDFLTMGKLCERFGVSRPTVRRALDLLHARGVLSEGRRGAVRVVCAAPGLAVRGRAAGRGVSTPPGPPQRRSAPDTHEQAIPGRAQ